MSLNPDEVGGKEYWHDKALASRQGADSRRWIYEQAIRKGPTSQEPTLARSHARKYWNLRHPIAGSSAPCGHHLGHGRLARRYRWRSAPVAPARMADCAMPSAALLGPPGAQFSVAFPDTAGLAGVGPGFCGYGMTRHWCRPAISSQRAVFFPGHLASTVSLSPADSTHDRFGSPPRS